MKSSIIILIVTFIGCSSCFLNKKNNFKNNVLIKNDSYNPLNTFKGDSLAYLYENFVENKDYYKDKKLEVMLHDLELPIEKYLVSLSNNNLNESNAITLILTDEQTFISNKNKKKFILLNITWKIPIDGERAFDLLKKSKTLWNVEAKEFYKDRIVKDINMVNYNP